LPLNYFLATTNTYSCYTDIKDTIKMIPYKSLSGKESGVAYYIIADTYIDVFFSGGHHYRYTNKSAGKAALTL